MPLFVGALQFRLIGHDLAQVFARAFGIYAILQIASVEIDPAPQQGRAVIGVFHKCKDDMIHASRR